MGQPALSQLPYRDNDALEDSRTHELSGHCGTAGRQVGIHVLDVVSVSKVHSASSHDP
jgi:hypothetical protein